jgi:hypothetical protein
MISVLVACGDDDDDQQTNTGNAQGAGRDGSVAAADAATSTGSSRDAATDGGSGEHVQHVDRSKFTDVGTTGSLDYASPGTWVCRPDVEPNECDNDLTATEIEADGSRTEVPEKRAADPDFDCFYVYPTVLLSGAAQMVDFSQAGVDIVDDALMAQGARFSRICRMYAPFYRQVGLAGGTPVAGADRTLGVQDVRDAFAYYLEHWNAGRKFVLLGHSQGTAMLTLMMQMDVDPDEHADVRARMISALLIGGGLTVPVGEKVGGTFKNIPTCSAPGETGCAITYASFASDGPPGDNSLFGRTSMAGMQVACVNPADMSGNTGRYRGSYFRKDIANASFLPDTPLPEDLATPFALYRDLFRGACVEKNDAHYLEITLEPSGADDQRTPPWRNTVVENAGFGLHLVDYQIPMEDLIDAVEMQAKSAQ